MININKRPIRRSKEQRKSPRQVIDLPTRIVIQDAVTDEFKGEGYARIHNIGPGGALISNLELFGQGLPISPFKVALIIEEGILKGVQMTCSVKWVSNGHRPPSCGLEFERISEKDRARIWNFSFIKRFS